MMFGLFLGDWTILIVLPALIFTLWAQAQVSGTFSKYSKVVTGSGITGAEAARRLLDAHGLYNVSINRIKGTDLNDHYDPRSNTLNLSEAVYDARTTAAVGVACHEAGHAIQHAEGYAPLNLRMAIIPVCNFGSMLAMPLFFIGLFFANGSMLGAWLMFAGIACFSLVTLFQLMTLPVEFNASRRAMEGIEEHGLLMDDERRGAGKVLRAAAMTYVAALATSLLSLLRLIVIANGSRKR
jgi:Zn-dependent membrane protease YugP